MKDDSTDKEDRRDRYNRKHGYAPGEALGSTPPPPRRKAPYKREQLSQGDYLEELDEDWFGFDNE